MIQLMGKYHGQIPFIRVRIDKDDGPDDAQQHGWCRSHIEIRYPPGTKAHIACNLYIPGIPHLIITQH